MLGIWLLHIFITCIPPINSLSMKHYNQQQKIDRSLQKPQFKEIPRVSVNEFQCHIHYFHNITRWKKDTNEFQSKSNSMDDIISYETPVIIENALTTDECESICDTMLSHLGSHEILIQRKTKTKINAKRNKNTKRKDMEKDKIEYNQYKCSFHQALQYMMQSKHNDSLFAFCEGLLHNVDNEKIKQIKDKLQNLRENFFHDSSIPMDYFHYFPMDIQPSDCVVLAGEGSSSTLHRDPFEWTGTSICLEGTKIWRFIPPPLVELVTSVHACEDVEQDDMSYIQYMDQFLNAYRLESVAWDKDKYDEKVSMPLSAGWQSDKSLFAYRNKDIKSAESISEMDESSRMIYLNDIVMNNEYLKMNIFDNNDEVNKNIPNSFLAPATSIWTTVQKPGDLLIIPAYWWHQTYGLEPNLAIASQRCGMERDARRVMNHIVSVSGVSHMDALMNDLYSYHPSDFVPLFFDRLLHE